MRPAFVGLLHVVASADWNNIKHPDTDCAHDPAIETCEDLEDETCCMNTERFKGQCVWYDENQPPNDQMFAYKAGCQVRCYRAWSPAIVYTPFVEPPECAWPQNCCDEYPDCVLETGLWGDVSCKFKEPKAKPIADCGLLNENWPTQAYVNPQSPLPATYNPLDNPYNEYSLATVGTTCWLATTADGFKYFQGCDDIVGLSDMTCEDIGKLAPGCCGANPACTESCCSLTDYYDPWKDCFDLQRCCSHAIYSCARNEGVCTTCDRNAPCVGRSASCCDIGGLGDCVFETALRLCIPPGFSKEDMDDIAHVEEDCMPAIDNPETQCPMQGMICCVTGPAASECRWNPSTLECLPGCPPIGYETIDCPFLYDECCLEHESACTLEAPGKCVHRVWTTQVPPQRTFSAWPMIILWLVIATLVLMLMVVATILGWKSQEADV
ncbi:MAG: uncharacterized protein KVP18_002514 [Porospora cf. gigantea A]|nr:MAG: hypothetical protein KVP18_002514 [Porospora cf. gigantea A]